MNYYDILKINKTASETEIKTSYKALVKKYHPDLYVGDKEFAEKKIKEINEAYDVLSDSTKKAEYDAYLQELDNPTPAPQTYKKAQTSYQQTTTNYQENKENLKPNPIIEFILKKFDKLDKKTQLRIFIMILVIILALFLLNLIQVKYYLTHSDHQKPNHSITTNTMQNNVPSNSATMQDNTIFNENDFTNSSYNFETLDDLLNEFIKAYEEETNNAQSRSDNTILEKTPDF